MCVCVAKSHSSTWWLDLLLEDVFTIISFLFMTKLRNCEFQLYNGIFNSLPDIIRFFPK